MATVKFGTGQINNPTPRGVNLAVRVFTVVAGIFLGWMQTNDLIDAHYQNIVSSILGLLLAVINGIAPLFGVETAQLAIPKEDVAAMAVHGS